MIFATAEDVGDVGEYDDARERDSLLAFVSSLNDVARLARRCDLGVGGAGIDVCRDVNTWLNESSTSGHSIVHTSLIRSDAVQSVG